MVDQLNSCASEVTRVAREVGTEGKLGGQAEVRASPVHGRNLTDSVIPWQVTHRTVRNIATVTTGSGNGDLSKKITVDREGRNSGTEIHNQHHGGSASSLRLK